MMEQNKDNSSEKKIPPLSRDTCKMTQKIGSTTYEVTIHFNKTSKESLEDKILRLIRSDIQNGQA